ncbi:MAG: S9 family peptidase [Candidatus Aquilonibacter sp.]
MKNLRFLVAGALACALLAPAAAQARSFTFDDYDAIVGVSDAQIAPDGKHVVIVVGHVDEKKDRVLRELVLIDTATGEQRILTHDREHVGDPHWSPRGDELAFIDVAGTGEDANAQVWVMPMSGGDAQPVTAAKNGVDAYAWRPDGKGFAYVSSDTPANETEIEHHDDLFIVDDDSFATRGKPVPEQLWMQTIGGTAVRLTEGSASVYPDQLSWSSDGNYIAFSRQPFAGYDGIFHSRAAVIEVATKHISELDTRWSWLTAFSPRGDRIAYSASRNGAPALFNDLAIASVGGERRKNAAPALDRDVDFITWLPGGDGLLVSADDRVAHGLWRVSTDGHSKRVDLGELNFEGGSVAGDGAIAFIGSSAKQPSELYYLGPGASTPKRLTSYNDDIANLDLAPSRELTWHNDGFDEDGVLTYPIGYESGKKYPLVLVIHGGPTIGASIMSFSPLVQVLAARGFFVLQPNYRASDNLGYAYANAIVGENPSFGAGSDCYAAAKAAIATGMIDPSRVGASGWSAGGWMTSWLLTHYDLFKASVTGAAVDDTVMQATLSQLNTLMPTLFGGLTPWSTRGMEAYRRNSPVTYAQDAKGATLIMSDTTDQRVPTPQAYEFYAALRGYGKDVEFIAIPASGHHPSDPVRNKAIDRTWVDWFVKHL